MTSRDDALVGIFIGMLNEAEGTYYELSERPDEVVRNEPSIEALATDRGSGSTLRIEHTRLEPFEGEGADFGRVRDIADALENDPNLAAPNRDVYVTFEVGAFNKFSKWVRDRDRFSFEPSVHRSLNRKLPKLVKSEGAHGWAVFIR